MNLIFVIFIIIAFVFVAGATIYLATSFLFDEKAMCVKMHNKDIIKHEVEIKHLIEKLDDEELRDSIDEELKQIHKHALSIKHILTNTR